ncbi:MAG: GLUG motif-containing protein [Planctomycetota bacterium]
MRRAIISVRIKSIIVFSTLLSASSLLAGTYSGGTGGPYDPYIINTAEDMNEIGACPNDWDKNFLLINDINLGDFTGTQFNIIGRSSKPFAGVFDGNGHTISNFTYRSGLFGYVSTSDAEIKNLGLIAPDVGPETGQTISYVGALVGTLANGTISNCYSAGAKVSGRWRVGGLVGQHLDGIISECYADGDVQGIHSVGGLVGFTGWGTISACYTSGSVTGEDRIGGLVGDNQEEISNCYSTSIVDGNSEVGGLVGCHWNTPISNCYSAGRVTGINDVGGLVGKNEWIVFGSYWDVNSSGQATSGGGRGRTTEEMMMESTFFGWGCDAVWKIDEGHDYPRLYWENKPGAIIQEPTYGGGNGEPNEPYLIYTAEQLDGIGLSKCHWDKHFKLMNDIDQSDYEGGQFNTIGGNYSRQAFTGVFDGDGHTISGLNYIITVHTQKIGLFGYVDDPNAEIRDLGLIEPNISAEIDSAPVWQYGPFGALVGGLYNGAINRCYVENGVVSVEYAGSVGGLVGKSHNGEIYNCYSTANVTADYFVGGLVGNSYNGGIYNSYSGGTVSGMTEVGGIVGIIYSGAISNCYSESVVSGYQYVGGLAGDLDRCDVYNCYSTGSVAGANDIGGLIGYIEWAKSPPHQSFWDVNTSGLDISYGGTGKTTAEMHSAGTFIGWGCGEVWTIDDGNDCPRLRWENKQGELITNPTYGGGSGEPNDPYQIYTAEQLNTVGLVRCDWDKHFKLMMDIDLSAYRDSEFNIIGNYYHPFTGVFDGNGHAIYNFSYDCNDWRRIGLFGYINDPNSEIKDLGFVDANIKAGTGYYIGSLVGYLEGGIIRDCYCEGGNISGDSKIGGLVGFNSYGIISNCRASGTVTGQYSVGGLAGSNNYGTLLDCYAIGEVSGGSNVGGLAGSSNNSDIYHCYSSISVRATRKVGGLLGRNFNGTIFMCHSSGDIQGDTYVGGLLGDNYLGTITNCYSTGSVSGDEKVGGFTGSNYNQSNNITDCYAAGPVDGNTYVGSFTGYEDNGNTGNYVSCFWDNTVNLLLPGIGNATDPEVIGESTTNMQTETTFTDAGWDFVGEVVNGPNDVWTIKEGQDYPKMVWELVNFVGWYEVDFVDYSFLAKYWQDINCADTNDCEGADLDFSGNVDAGDLKIFCQHWGDGL